MYKWIANSGECLLTELSALIRQEMGQEECCYIAMMTDRFTSGKYTQDAMTTDICRELLEIRIFNENKEFLAARSTLDAIFQWRSTDDGSLVEGDQIVTAQFIDINEQKPSLLLENGNRTLFTTGGGAYSLPITESQKRIKIKHYIGYDHNGIAKIVDARICCFTA